MLKPPAPGCIIRRVFLHAGCAAWPEEQGLVYKRVEHTLAIRQYCTLRRNSTEVNAPAKRRGV